MQKGKLAARLKAFLLFWRGGKVSRRCMHLDAEVLKVNVQFCEEVCDNDTLKTKRKKKCLFV